MLWREAHKFFFSILLMSIFFHQKTQAEQDTSKLKVGTFEHLREFMFQGIYSFQLKLFFLAIGLLATSLCCFCIPTQLYEKSCTSGRITLILKMHKRKTIYAWFHWYFSLHSHNTSILRVCVMEHFKIQTLLMESPHILFIKKEFWKYYEK